MDTILADGAGSFKVTWPDAYKLLAESVRERDALVRLAGEIAVILAHCPADQARGLAEQIYERMDDFRFTDDCKRFRIGASVGLVQLDHPHQG
ncbi:GGDEF domain-containing protein [Roseateles sp.]|uniref:GGDEF domain-containing protein n=1 Tax=Roseateles sp. TaxID=1971397 RepID=UPI00359FC2E0